MADENENANDDPFKDFIQEEFKDGVAVQTEAKVDDKKVDDDDALEGDDEVVDENDDGKVDDKKDDTKVDDKKSDDEPPKKKQTAKERIAELTRIRRQQEQELEEYRTGKRQPAAKADELPVKVAKLDDIPEEHRDAVKAEQAKRVAALGAAPKKPNPADFEFGSVDEKYLDARDAYNRSIGEYEAKKSAAENSVFDEISKAVSERETALAKFDAKIDEGKKLFDDFEEVVVKGVDEGRFPLSRTVALLMVDSEVGAQVAYHLAKNPDEAKSIAALPDAQQAARFGALEVKFLAEGRASSEPKQDKTQTKTPQAPAPIEQPRGQGGQFASYADSEDFATFEKGHEAAARRKSG